MTANRAGEDTLHHTFKTWIGTYLKRKAAFLICLFEWSRCDAFLLKPGRALAVECELSTRNCTQNALRNFAGGCTHLLVATVNEQTRRAIKRKFARELPPALLKRISTVTPLFSI